MLSTRTQPTQRLRRVAVPVLAAAAGVLVSASTALAAPPSNDDRAAAAPIGAPPVTVAGTLAGATREPGENHYGDGSVWYSFSPSVSAAVAVENDFPLSADTTLAVYVREAGGGLRPIGRDGHGAMRVVLDAAAGETYLIMVGGDPAAEDVDFSLRVRPLAPPPNDAFADAKVLRIPGRYAGTVLDAGAELGEPRHVSPAEHSVWYRITPRRTGRLTLEASTANDDASVAVYTGSELGALRRVTGAFGRPVRFVAIRGRTYHVAVDVSRPSDGAFMLDVSDGGVAGKGLELAVLPGQTVDGIARRGLRVSVSTRRQVTVGLELRVDRRAARRLGLRTLVLGRARGTLRPGDKLPATIGLTPAARRALSGVSRLRAVARVTILRSTAPDRILDVPFRLAG